MLQELIQQVEIGLPRAWQNPINDDQFDNYIFHCRDTVEQARQSFVGPYALATLRLAVSQLDLLSEKEFCELKRQIQTATKSYFASISKRVPREVGQHIAPKSNINVLQHEWDHFKEVPRGNRETGLIDLVCKQSDGSYSQPAGKLTMSGATVYEQTGLSDRQLALIQVRPEVLSCGDVCGAWRYSDRTGDQKFIQEIRDVIASRIMYENIVGLR